MELLRRAAHEARVSVGIVLVALAAFVGYYDKLDSQRLADRDFALCGAAQTVRDCTSKIAPVFTGWNASSGNGFRRVYFVSVATGRHSTVTIGGLSKADVVPFESQKLAELRYRQGRLAAVVGPTGATIKVPFAFTHKAIGLGIVAGVLALAGGGLFAWGFARLNNRPRPAPNGLR
jgi:hypothetical protein